MYLLRWVFHYLDGRKKHGLWSDPGRADDKSTQAWSQPTSGLANACVEARCLRTGKEIVMAEIKGADFCAFQWIGTVPLSHGKHLPRIRGMVLVGRDFQFIVTRDGKIQPTARTWKDNIMLYGRANQ